MKLRRLHYYIIAILIRIPLVALFAHDWDMYVFTTTTRLFLLEGILPYDPIMEQKLLAYIPYYPSQYNWYAYPPLPLLIFSMGYVLYLLFSLVFGINGVFFERFFVGLSISFGDIVLAYFSHKLGLEISGQKKARKIELSILFNPFIIFVSSLWGMIDSWSAAFFVASIYYLSRNQHKKAAIYYALSILVKQLTLLLAPIFIVFQMRRTGGKGAIKFIAIASATFIIVSLPFIIMHPANFIYQVFLFHLGRYPQGVSVPGVIFIATYTLISQSGGSLAELRLLSTSITFISFVLMTVFILWISTKLLSADSLNNGYFLSAIFTALLVILFLNKVSNPQYFVLLSSIGIIYGYTVGGESALIRTESISKTVMCLMILTTLGGINFFSLSPYMKLSILRTLWIMFIKKDAIIYTPSMAIISMITIIATLKLYWLFIETYLHESLSLKLEMYTSEQSRLWGIVGKLKVLSRRIIFTLESGNRSTIIILAIILTGFVIGIVANRVSYQSSINSQPPENQTENRVSKYVGIFYNWYINPLHDFNKSCGPWSNAKLVPIDGFYDSSTQRLEKDLEVMSEIGVDFLLIDVMSTGALLTEQIAETIQKHNLSFALFINISRLIDDPTTPQLTYKFGTENITEKYLELNPNNIYLIKKQISGIIQRFNQFPNYFKTDNRSMFVIHGLQRFLPGWSYESKSYLTSALLDMYKEKYNDTDNETVLLSHISNETQWNISSIDDLINRYYPKNISDLITNETYGPWIQAFQYAWSRDILSLIPSNISAVITVEYMPVNLIPIKLLDNMSVSLVPYPNRYVMFNQTDYNTLQEQYIKSNRTRLLLAIPNYIVDKNHSILINSSTLYNDTWKIAIKENINITLIYGWNIYSSGSAIEPTREFGNKTLEITRIYVKLYKGENIQFKFVGSKIDIPNAYNVLMSDYVARRYLNKKRE